MCNAQPYTQQVVILSSRQGIYFRKTHTLRYQINEQGVNSASRVGLVITFFCLFIFFFLYVSLLALFPSYSFIWHPRVLTFLLRRMYFRVRKMLLKNLLMKSQVMGFPDTQKWELFTCSAHSYPQWLTVVSQCLYLVLNTQETSHFYRHQF